MSFLSNNFRIAVITSFLLFGLSLGSVKSISATETDPPLSRYEQIGDIPYQPLSTSSAETDSVQNFSPLLDWSRTVFQSYRDNNWEIYFGNDNLTGLSRVTSNPSVDIQPNLNRGATRVVFTSNRNGNYDIFSVNPDGSGLQQLTFNPANDVYPVWSPDGARVVFQSYRDGQSEIYVMNSNGSNQTRLTYNTDSTNGNDFDGQPAWSPDGTRIAFVSKRSGGYRIWVMNENGSAPIQLSNQAYSANPKWSPNGAQIAYDTDDTGDGWQNLWLMNANGSSQQRIVEMYGSIDTWASGWSPNGQYVTFTLIQYVQYQNQWYWTSAVPYTWETTTNHLQVMSLAGPNYRDWSLDWQTADTLPPQSNVNILFDYKRVTENRIEWAGTDNGIAGIETFDIQFRLGELGAWADWQSNTSDTFANFPSQSGQKFYFRSRARDRAGNVEAWPTFDYGDANTTYYEWQLFGKVTNNRNQPIVSLPIMFTPNAINSVKLSSKGQFIAYLPSSDQYTLTTQAGAFSAIAPSTISVTADSAFDFYIPPVDNLIANSSFESPTPFANWTTTGSLSKTITTTARLLGKQGVLLGTNCMFPCLSSAEPTYGGNYYSSPDLEVDGQGTLHFFWVEGGGIRYAFRNKQSSSWSPQALIVEIMNYPYNVSPRTAIDGQDTIHLIWFDSAGLNYRNKSSSGDWSAITTLGLGNANTMAITADENGGVHVLRSSYEDGAQLYYHERLPNGNWLPAVSVGPYVGRSNLVIGPDNTLHLLYTTSDYQVFFRFRDANGIWSTPEHLSTGGWASAQDIAIDSKGTAHIFWTSTRLHYLSRTLNGRWSNPVQLARPLALTAMALDRQGGIHIIGGSGYAGEEGIYYTYKASDGTWLNSYQISSNPFDVNAIWPTLVIDSNDSIHIVSAGSYYKTQLSTITGNATLRQAVVIPNNMHKPTLAYQYRLGGTTPTTGSGFRVQISNGSSTTTVVSTTVGTNGSLAWVDLQPWMGQTITVTFSVNRNNSSDGNIQLYLDDVSVGSWKTPTITSISPTQIKDVTNSSILTISGDNFISTPTILLGDIPLLNPQWINETALQATVPTGTPIGTYDLRVINPGNQEAILDKAVVIGHRLFLPIVSR